MDLCGDLGLLQSRAEQHLQSLVQGCPAQEIPRRIAHLAISQGDNPLKDLFRAADGGHAPRATTASDESGRTSEHGSHRSKFSLRFSRNKDKAKAGPSASHDFQSICPADVKAPASELDAAHRNATYHPDSATKSRNGSTQAYRCIFCQSNYTTKGTCKRHLEEIHVAKRYFRCVKCSRKFGTAPEARKHCATCGVGVLGWNTETPEAHKIYSSEFIDHQLFSTPQLYINHLLGLSASPLDVRPVRSWHRKLRNLLEQPVCQTQLRALSIRLFKSADGWREVRWEHERVRRAVKELECGILNRQLDPCDMLMLRRVESFLEELFKDRCVAGSESPERPPPPVPAPVMKIEPPSEMEGVSPALPQRPPDVPPKRPLSFESSSLAPRRQPPGPPDPSLDLGDQQMQPGYGQAHLDQHLPDIPDTNGTMGMVQPPASTAVVTHTTKFRQTVPEQQQHPMMYWPPPETQPPPYESRMASISQTQSMSNLNLLQQQGLSTGGYLGFNANLANYADATPSSTALPGTTYMPTTSNNLNNFYVPPTQIDANYSNVPSQQPQMSNGDLMAFSPMVYSPAQSTYTNGHGDQQFAARQNGQQFYGGQH